MQQVHSVHSSQSHRHPDSNSPISPSPSRHPSINQPPATSRESPQLPLNMVGPSHPMPRQRVYFGPYLLLQTLGEGEFGKVKLGVHSSPERWGEEVAIKLIKRGNVDTQARMIKVAREIDVLKLVKHPNIVRLYDVIETEKYIGIVLEYASGGELFDHILAHRYLKEKDASKLFAQLISGVTYLHAKKIVHRDLKLENLLLDRNRNIIITDFGFANRFEDRSNDLMATSCGSPCYAAPELVVQDGRYVGSQVDVWSCGVILYAMLAGYLPFDDDPSNPDGDNINLLYKYIINTPLSFPDWITDEPKDLLLKMLVPDPLKRCSLKDVTHHPWLAKYKHLFHRSLEEYERISEDNEQTKRLMLQRQRQLMATNNSHQSRATLGVDASRTQTSAGTTPAHKSRAHQSATVVPSAAMLSPDDHLGHPAGAYQQQQRQVNSGVVTHLQPNTSHLAPVAPRSNRRQHAQSAVVATVVNPRDDATLPSAPITTQDQTMLDGDLKASRSSASSARKRKVGSPNPTSTSGPSQQRYTVQVEYTGDPKGKSKNMEPPTVVHDDMDVDGINTSTAGDADHTTLTPVHPHTPPVGVTSVATNNTESQSLATPHPGRTRKTSDHAPSPDARTNHLETPKPFDSGTIDPSLRTSQAVVSASSTSRDPSTIQDTIEAPKNASQVSFSATSQTSVLPNGASKAAVSKSQNRHRKGLSTDRFLSRLLGTSTAQPTTPPPVPNPKKSSVNNTAGTKAARRKALSMVVEPLSGKSSSTTRHSKRFGGNKSSTTTANSTEPQYSDHSKRRTRGNSVAAPHLSTNSDLPVTSSTKPEAGLPQRRITLTAATGRHSKTSAHTASQVVSAKTGSQRSEQTALELPSNSENNNPPPIDTLTGSQNWGHHTPAASLANSTGQASNSSKAKRVMDWFRFKSLNGSSISANQASLQVHDHLTPPVPIPTDFDARIKANQETFLARSDQQSVQAGTPDLVGPSHPQPSLMPSAASSKISPRFTSAHPRPNTSTAAEFPHRPNLSSSVTERTTSYNDSKLKLHHGAIDQNAISSKLPPMIMQQLKQILWEMGIDVVEESSMKLKATRRSKKKVVASLGMGVLEALQQQQQRLNQQEQSTGALKSIFHRRPQTVSTTNQQIGVLIDQFGNVTTGSGAPTSVASMNGGSVGSANGPEQQNRPRPLPSYADDPSVDSGDDVRFTVEITKLRGLVGLYAVDIKRLKGSLWSFKYLYLQILERADLGQKE